MFGLGMTNNGTGLVLGSAALAHVPDVMLPVIFYNLVQHVIAAIAEKVIRKYSSVKLPMANLALADRTPTCGSAGEYDPLQLISVTIDRPSTCLGLANSVQGSHMIPKKAVS